MKGKILLSPLERYYWYGAPPYKFSLHLMLIILTSLVALYLQGYYERSHVPQRVIFYSMFMNTESQEYQKLTEEYSKF